MSSNRAAPASCKAWPFLRPPLGSACAELPMVALMRNHRRKERLVLRTRGSHRREHRRTRRPGHDMADSRRPGGERYGFSVPQDVGRRRPSTGSRLEPLCPGEIGEDDRAGGRDVRHEDAVPLADRRRPPVVGRMPISREALTWKVEWDDRAPRKLRRLDRSVQRTILRPSLRLGAHPGTRTSA